MIKIRNKKLLISLLLTLTLCLVLLLDVKSYAFYTLSDDIAVTFAIKDIEDYKNAPYLMMFNDPNLNISSSDDISFTIENESSKVLLNIIPLNEDSSFNYKDINVSDISFMKEFTKKYNFMFEVNDEETGIWNNRINGENIPCLISNNDNYVLGIFVYKDYLYTMKTFYKKEYDKTNEVYNRPLSHDEIISELSYITLETINAIKLDKIERDTALEILTYTLDEKNNLDDEDIDDDFDDRDKGNVASNENIYKKLANYLYNNDDVRDFYEDYVKKVKTKLGLKNANDEIDYKIVNVDTLFFITIIWIVLMILILFIINKNKRKSRVKTVIIMFLLYLLVMPLLIEFFNKTGYVYKSSMITIFIYGVFFTLVLGTAVDLGITYGVFIKLFNKQSNLYDMDDLHESNDSPYIK